MDPADPSYQEVVAVVEYLKDQVSVLRPDLEKKKASEPFHVHTVSLLVDGYRSNTNSPSGILVIADSPAQGSSSAESSRAGSVVGSVPINRGTENVSAINGNRKSSEPAAAAKPVDSDKLNESEIDETMTVGKMLKNRPKAPAHFPLKEIPTITKPPKFSPSKITCSTSTTSTTTVSGASANANKSVKKMRLPQQATAMVRYQPILPAGAVRRPLKPKLSNTTTTKTNTTNATNDRKNTPLSPGEKIVKEVVADLCRDQQAKLGVGIPTSAVTAVASPQVTIDENPKAASSISGAAKNNNENGSAASMASSTFDSVMSDVIEGRASTSLHEIQTSDFSMPSLKKSNTKSRSRVSATKNAKIAKKLAVDTKTTLDPNRLNQSGAIPNMIFSNQLAMAPGNMISMPGGVQQFVIQTSSPPSALTDTSGNLISVLPSQPMFLGSQSDGRKSGGFHVLLGTNDDNNIAPSSSTSSLPPNFVPSSMYFHMGSSAVVTNATCSASLPGANNGNVASRVNQLKPLQPKTTAFASAPSASSRSGHTNLSKSTLAGGAPVSLAPSVRMSTSTHSTASDNKSGKAPTAQYFYLQNSAGVNFAASTTVAAINGSATVGSPAGVNGNGTRVVQLAPSYLALPNLGPANLAMLASTNQARFFPSEQFSTSKCDDSQGTQFRSIAPAMSIDQMPSIAMSIPGDAAKALKNQTAARRKRKPTDQQISGTAEMDPPLLNCALDEFVPSNDGIMEEEEEENEPPPLLYQDEATSLHGLFLKEAMTMRQQFYEYNGDVKPNTTIKHFIGGVLIEENISPFACENADLLDDGKTSPLSDIDVKPYLFDREKFLAKEEKTTPSEDVEKKSNSNISPKEETPKSETGPKVGRRGRRKRKPATISPSVSPSSSTCNSPVDEKLKGATPSSSSSTTGQPPAAKRGRKPGGCREISGLLQMDFGPGKTPFQTTSIERYTEEIMVEAKQQQRCLAFDAHLVRRSSESCSTPPPSTSSITAADDKVAEKRATSPLRNIKEDVVEEEECCRVCQQKFSQIKRRHPTKPQYCSKECQRKFKDKKVKERSLRQFEIRKSPHLQEITSQPATVAATEVPAVSSQSSSSSHPQKPQEKLSPSKVTPPQKQQQSSSPNNRISSPISVLAKRLPCNTSPPTLAPARNAAAALHTQRGVNSPPSAFQLKALTPRKPTPTAILPATTPKSSAGGAEINQRQQPTPQWPQPYMTLQPQQQTLGEQKSPSQQQPPALSIQQQQHQRQHQQQKPPNQVVSFIPSSAVATGSLPPAYNNYIYTLQNVPQQPQIADFNSAQLIGQPQLQPRLPPNAATLIGFSSPNPSTSSVGLFRPPSVTLLASAHPTPPPPTPPQSSSVLSTPQMTSLPSTSAMSSAERNSELERLTAKEVTTWTEFEVARWASLVTNSDANAEPFLRNNVDGADLIFMDLERMKKHLGLKLGPAMKLNNALNTLRGGKLYGEKRLRMLYAENAELHKLNARGFDNWTREDVGEWAAIVTNSRDIGQKFFVQDIDSGSLKLLERQQFREELGIKLGPTLELEDALNIFHANN